MQLFREAGKAVCAMPALLFQPIYVSIYLHSITIDDYISVSYRRFMSTNRILANAKYSRLFSDVSAHRIHDDGVDLLYAMDRERR